MFHYNLTRTTGTVHKNQYTFFIISRLVFIGMRKVSDKTCRKIQNTHFMFIFFNHAFYEIKWKNIVQPGRPQMTTWRMPIACWIPKDTKTLSEYVTLIAFPLHQWLHERASMIRYTCSDRLVAFYPAWRDELLEVLLNVPKIAALNEACETQMIEFRQELYRPI
jgi:hypothetical protein